MTDTPYEPTTAVPAQPAPAPEHPAVLELGRVRRLIREHLASADLAKIRARVGVFSDQPCRGPPG